MDNREYQPLTIPKIKWDTNTLTADSGELTAQPLEPGFGITMGNALRRILLGGIEGAAVTYVVIKGVNNEFSALPGVVEDTMQLVLNIKEVVVKSKDGKSGKMRLKVQGEATATVADIQADDNLELVNNDHVLAQVAPGGELDIEFYVEPGRGYQRAQWPIGTALQEDDRIYVDAMFSPIRKVAFEVEKTRVGDAIDYDKLILNVETDGSIGPVDAVHYAVSVLRTQLDHFLAEPEIPFNKISTSQESTISEDTPDVAKVTIQGIPVDLLLKPIEELELSVRAHNCLLQAGIKRILDLVNLSEDEGLKIKNFGRKSLNEVVESMNAFGLSFGMNIKEEDVKAFLQQ